MKDDKNYRLITCVYIGMGTGFLYRDMPERAAHYAELVSDECAGRIDGIELLSFRCFKAEVCHATGKTAARDECIRLICEEIFLVIFMNSASFCLKSEMMMLFCG